MTWYEVGVLVGLFVLIVQVGAVGRRLLLSNRVETRTQAQEITDALSNIESELSELNRKGVDNSYSLESAIEKNLGVTNLHLEHLQKQIKKLPEIVDHIDLHTQR